MMGIPREGHVALKIKNGHKLVSNEIQVKV